MSYLVSPGRGLFSQGRGLRSGAIPGTDAFGDTPPYNIDQNPHPYSGLSQRRAGSHACLWTDQIPDLQIYVVINYPGPSRVSEVSIFLRMAPIWGRRGTLLPWGFYLSAPSTKGLRATWCDLFGLVVGILMHVPKAPPM